MGKWGNTAPAPTAKKSTQDTEGYPIVSVERRSLGEDQAGNRYAVKVLEGKEKIAVVGITSLETGDKLDNKRRKIKNGLLFPLPRFFTGVLSALMANLKVINKNKASRTTKRNISRAIVKKHIFHNRRHPELSRKNRHIRRGFKK